MNGQSMTTSCVEYMRTTSCDEFAVSPFTNNICRLEGTTQPCRCQGYWKTISNTSTSIRQTNFGMMPCTHLLKTIYNGNITPRASSQVYQGESLLESYFKEKMNWRIRVSIPVPLECKSSALPLELIPLLCYRWGEENPYSHYVTISENTGSITWWRTNHSKLPWKKLVDDG